MRHPRRSRAGHRRPLQRRGRRGQLVAYATSQAHSSIEKGLRIAGIGSDNLRLVDVDDGFAMRPDALAAADGRRPRPPGCTPFFVVATAGTTSSLAFDPVPAIAEVCRREDLWLHVDAAMAGVGALVPALAWIQDGVDQVDSYCTNPHKWMGVNFDCDLFWVADRTALLRALSILPEYLRTAAGESGAVVDYRDWQVPLGRRFRALKLWFVLRTGGAAEARAMIERHCRLATELAGWVDARPRVRAGRTACAQPGRAPPHRRRRGHRRRARRGQRLGCGPVHPHRARRALGDPLLRRGPHHRAATRRGRLAAAAGRGVALGLKPAGLRRTVPTPRSPTPTLPAAPP